MTVPHFHAGGLVPADLPITLPDRCSRLPAEVLRSWGTRPGEPVTPTVVVVRVVRTEWARGEDRQRRSGGSMLVTSGTLSCGMCGHGGNRTMTLHRGEVYTCHGCQQRGEWSGVSLLKLPWWSPPPGLGDVPSWLVAMREVEALGPVEGLPVPPVPLDYTDLNALLAGTRPRVIVDSGRLRESVTVEHCDNRAYLALVSATEAAIIGTSPNPRGGYAPPEPITRTT